MRWPTQSRTFVHVDIHIVNGLLRFVEGLCKAESLELGFELRQRGNISQTGRRRIFQTDGAMKVNGH